MKWTKFTLDTTTQAVDLVSDMLNELGIEGIEVKDKVPITEEEKKHMFVDFLPVLGEDDGKATVNFYTDPSLNVEDILMKVRDGLTQISGFVSIGSGNIEVSETEDKDWANNWKQFFKPFRIDDTIIIKPTWEDLKDKNANDLVIEIDPGMSFGTGSHETTKLCIISLKKYMQPGFTVLDAGSGSGILSIVAKKLGAASVLGVDIDPMATSSSIENANVNKLNAVDLNNLSEDHLSGDQKTQNNELDDNQGVAFVTGNIIEDAGIRSKIGKGKYDIVVANILADVIIPLSKVIGENMKPGAIFISSGIIDMKEAAVNKALLENNFTVLEVNRMGDWVSFVARK